MSLHKLFLVEKIRKTKNNGGFTLVEMIIALAILTILVVVLFPLFSETIHFSKVTTTRARLNQLVKGLKVAYEKDAMVIDTTGANGDIVFTSNWSQVLGNPANPLGSGTLTAGNTVTVTPVQSYTFGDPSSLETGFSAIAGAAGASPLALATDGFGHPFWVYVSPEIEGNYDGYTVYYHDVGFLSTDGAPSSVTPMSQGVTYTCTVSETGQDGCSFNLGSNGGQFDSVSSFSGYAVELKLFKDTLRKMNIVADDYGSYFTTEYLANAQRNEDYDYFAGPDTAWDGCGPNGQGGNIYMDSNMPNSGNGSNGGPGYAFPGENPNGSTVSYYGSDTLNDVQPATWDGNSFITNLGLSLSSVTSSWGFLMGVGNGPNSINLNGVVDRDPLSCNTSLQNPPYTAFIVAWAPNNVLLSVPVVGNY